MAWQVDYSYGQSAGFDEDTAGNYLRVPSHFYFKSKLLNEKIKAKETASTQNYKISNCC